MCRTATIAPFAGHSRTEAESDAVRAAKLTFDCKRGQIPIRFTAFAIMDETPVLDSVVRFHAWADFHDENALCALCEFCRRGDRIVGFVPGPSRI